MTERARCRELSYRISKYRRKHENLVRNALDAQRAARDARNDVKALKRELWLLRPERYAAMRERAEKAETELQNSLETIRRLGAEAAPGGSMIAPAARVLDQAP